MNTMFGFHTALASEILAAIAAAFLVVVAANRTGTIKTFGTWIGSLGVLFSVFGMLCTIYYGIAYWKEGVYSPKSVSENQQVQSMMNSMHVMHQNMREMMDPKSSDEHHLNQPEAGR